MRYTIYGFDQKVLVKYGLDLIDAALLRYFVDFKGSGLMISEEVEGKTYYWVKYDAVIEELPIINLKKDSVYRRLKKLCEAKILTHTTIINNGTYSYYGIGENYEELIYRPSDLKTESCVSKSEVPSEENPEQKILLLKDSNTKKQINTEVIEFLNKKAGTNYKTSSKKTRQLINARLRESFTLDDFKKVITKKTKQWIGTLMEKYLRPETLFGSKFEGYVNEKISLKPDESDNKCSIYKEFKFDSNGVVVEES